MNVKIHPTKTGSANTQKGLGVVYNRLTRVTWTVPIVHRGWVGVGVADVALVVLLLAIAAAAAVDGGGISSVTLQFHPVGATLPVSGGAHENDLRFVFDISHKAALLTTCTSPE